MRRAHVAALLSVSAALGAGGWLLSRGRPGQLPDEDYSSVVAAVAPIVGQSDEPYTIQPPKALGERPAELVLMLFVDGMASAPFREQLNAGRLPHIQRLLDERPSILGTALGTFPTSTAPAVPELLTGSWSHRQVGGPDKIHAFDRRSGRLLRYEVEGRAWDSNHPTIFDLVTASGGSALSYFEGYFPGASLNVHDELNYLLDIAEDKVRAQKIGNYDAQMVRDFSARLAAVGRAPNLAFIRLGAVDTAGHFYGPSSPQYAAAIRSVDTRVGELLHQLELARLPDDSALLEHTHVLFFSDHGMSDTRDHLDLDAVLTGLGLSPWATSSPAAVVETVLDDRGAMDHDVVAVPGGSNISAIYVRARLAGGLLPWSKTLDSQDLRALPIDGKAVDLVGALIDTEGVALVTYPLGEHTLRVERGGPGASLHRRLEPDGAWTLAYQPDDPEDDPFGYCGEAPALCCPELAAACFLTPAAWSEATADHPTPSAPFYFFKAFSGPRLNRQDLLVTAAPGWGFMAEMRGDHGDFRSELLHVPLLISSPSAELSSLDGARLVDLFPTALSMLGLPPTLGGSIDGRSLLAPE